MTKALHLFLITLTFPILTYGQLQETRVEKGSFMKALFNRSSLGRYALKIKAQNITYDEVTDYIKKGGNLDNFKYYSFTKEFFHSAPEYSILNHFLKEGYTSVSAPPARRLDILKVFLQAGSNPNFFVPNATFLAGGYLAPVLQACATDDIDALKLFSKYKGNFNLVEEIYTGLKGPCLNIVTSKETLNWLISQNANIKYLDPDGRNLLFLAANARQPIHKLKWLLDQGVSPNQKDNHGESTIERLNWLINSSDKIIESTRKSHTEGHIDYKSLQSTLKHEKELKGQYIKVRDFLIKPLQSSYNGDYD